jgi:hypothetical protein
MPSLRVRLLGLGAAFVVVLAMTRVAVAAPAASTSPAAPAATSPGDDGPAADELPLGGIAPGTVPWRPWSLFDPYLSPRSTVLTGGPAWERFIGQGYEHRGFEVTVGRSIEDPPSPRPLLVRLEMEFGVRVSDPSHWVLSLARYSYAGALDIGPVELSARAGATVAEVHFGSSGFGLGLLSPRVSAGATVRAGPIRIGAVAFSEYAWRWIGGPNALVQGVLLEIGLGRTPDGLPSYYGIKN